MRQTQRFLYYNLAHTGSGEDAHYIDIGKDLSNINRRLYRQGMCYHVANITVHDSQGSARVLFSTAPNTWALHTAWKLAFQAWKKQRAQVLSSGSGVMKSGKWADFKVYLNKEHVYDADWPRVREDEEQPINQDTGEWNYSNITFNRSSVQYDDYAIGLMGQHQFSAITNETTPHDSQYDGYLSMLEMLQEVRVLPVTGDAVEPSDVEESILMGMNLYEDDVVEDILEELTGEGDEPPYALDIVGGSTNPSADTGAWPARECHIASQFSPMAQVGGFPVPCGLMQIETTSGDDNTIGLLIELAPGDYKGVSAYPMG